MDEVLFNKYRVRASFFGNYIAADYLISFYEKLPIFSVYQSVVITLLGLHLFGLGLFFIILRWQLGHVYQIFLIATLISVFPNILGVFQIYRFSFRGGETWLNILPRSPMVFVILSALVILSNPGRKLISKTKIRILAVLLISISFYFHLTMALFYLVLIVLFWGLYRLFHYTPVKLAAEKGISSVYIPFILNIIIVAIIKFILFDYWDIEMIGPNMIGLSWLIAVIIIFYLWMQLRQFLIAIKPTLAFLGDLFINSLIYLSVLGLGLEILLFDTRIIRWTNNVVFLIMETGSRLGFTIHLLFWLMAGLIGYILVINPAPKYSIGLKRALLLLLVMPLIILPSLNNLLVVLFGFLTYQIFQKTNTNHKSTVIYLSLLSILVLMSIRSFKVVTHELIAKRQIVGIFECNLLFVNVSTQLDTLGAEAYQDQIAYYQGISNEMRLKYLPEALIESNLSCQIIPSLK